MDIDARSSPTLSMANMNYDAFDKVSMEALRTICRRHRPISRKKSSSRAVFYANLAALPPEILELIHRDVLHEVEQGHTKYHPAQDDNQRPRKRRRVQVAIPLEEEPTHDEVENLDYYDVSPERVEQVIQSEFLQAPDNTILNQRLEKFIDATGNESLLRKTCGSCARDRLQSEYKIVKVQDVPHPELLVPHKPHPAHFIFHSMLLHPTSVVQDGQAIVFCMECLHSLKSKEQPKFSLANNMWVGEIPHQLADLTLPERMLIARYYPAAYIVKLYPKQQGSRAWDKSQMHNGLRGNVSTYKLDPKQVASMIDGTHSVYPPNPKILSATIGITFVGPKGLKESSMPNMFRVRRWKVREALVWLREHNPLYSDITLSESNLEALPENGIPDELLLTAKYSSAKAEKPYIA